MDIVVNSWKNLMRRKMKFMLTLIGIIIGVVSVVVISGIGDIGKAQVNNELNSMGVGGILVSANKKGDTVSLQEDELESLRSLEEIQQVSPLIVDYSSIKVKNKNSESIIWGISENTADIISMEVIYGRQINESDIVSSNNVCMVDESFAIKHYARSNIVGKNIDIKFGGGYESFEIVGITKSGGNVLQSLMGSVVPTFAYVPYTSVQMLSLESNINQMVVKLKDGTDEILAEEAISYQIDKSTGVTNSVKIENLNAQIEKLNNVLDIVSVALTFIGGISLVVSGLSIMTIMLVCVSERTREIGIKKAIGASQKDIILEFIVEAVLITIIGGIIGVVIGVSITALGCFLLGISVIINVKSILFVLMFSVLIGVIFGVYPAYKASRLKPVDALRCE